jgi:hypothetical protein
VTTIPPQDPLVSLWHTAPDPDPQQIVQAVQRFNRLHQRQIRAMWAIVLGLSVLFIFEEATGRLSSHGILSVLWIGCLIIGFFRQKRSRSNRLDAWSLDTVRLLKTMIARARRDLFLARCLWAGVPCGAAVGYVLAKLAGIGALPGASAAHPNLERMQTGAGVATLVIMIVTGVILARSRSAQVRELSARLRSIESDV